ncbi:MAG: hypothetical protein O3C28_02365 [Proteobacteria bacterium]|nr:hypothetical protein [Pseudomonadota bacterium]
MALFITSSGYFSHTHDARVDMQYSFWILAAFAAFVATLRAHYMKSAARPWPPSLNVDLPWPRDLVEGAAHTAAGGRANPVREREQPNA